LDGLHEDLNRIKNKPYVELIKEKGENDDLEAVESWKRLYLLICFSIIYHYFRYKLRNDSVIVDFIHGQVKNVVDCNFCSNRSIMYILCYLLRCFNYLFFNRYEPFSLLSVPVPYDEEKEKEKRRWVFVYFLIYFLIIIFSPHI
jgi:hypothetical protein